MHFSSNFDRNVVGSIVTCSCLKVNSSGFIQSLWCCWYIKMDFVKNKTQLLFSRYQNVNIPFCLNRLCSFSMNLWFSCLKTHEHSDFKKKLKKSST